MPHILQCIELLVFFWDLYDHSWCVYPTVCTWYASPTQRTSLPVLQRLLLHGPCVLLSATVPSWRLLHLFGTVCRSQFGLRHHCQSSAVDWRLCFSLGFTAAPTRTMNSASINYTACPLLYCKRVQAVFGLYAMLKALHLSSSSSSLSTTLYTFIVSFLSALVPRFEPPALHAHFNWWFTHFLHQSYPYKTPSLRVCVCCTVKLFFYFKMHLPYHLWMSFLTTTVAQWSATGPAS